LAEATKWWHRWPGRLSYELKDLRRLGVLFEVDRDEWLRGRLVLSLTATVAGGTHDLRAIFPPDFPKVRPEVLAPGLSLPLHQNPFTKSLCLLGRSLMNWQPSMTLAWLIERQLPAVITAANTADRSTTAALEEAQGEPITEFYTYLDKSIVMIDGSWRLPEEEKTGTMQLAVEPAANGFRAFAVEVRGEKNNILVTETGKLGEIHADARIRGRWVRVKAAPLTSDPSAIVEVAADVDRDLRRPNFRKSHGQYFDVLGVTFPEEHLRGEYGDGWFFVLRRGVEIRTRYGKDTGLSDSFLVRSGRYRPTDLMQRVPSVGPLSRMSVAVLGIGCLGAPSAIELARAGVGLLRLVDSDYVDPATVARWSLGVPFAGWRKVDALAEFIRTQYPHVEVEARVYHIGGSGEVSIEEVLEDVDLVYDATGDRGAQRLASDAARQIEIPFIGISATPGGLGDQIFRLNPAGPCFMCLMLHLDADMLPSPPFDPNATIQPAGCANPTFVAANVDVGSIPLLGVKLATATLLADDNAVSKIPWDVATLTVEQAGSQTGIPTWSTAPLTQHPECPNHT
jgi:molybdopterin/thiamine biosynthesis adenylyltransferase